ncbi:transcriptional regulator, LysR family [Marinospirillum celere]|uniref:Transcriptional regulator, LysR family n=1 Tax=Marinospirillum celere TaxID=1122252 RepID=A0A1I1GMU7_9GAMM|nr:LysR family transcriptional regulator [Marinospirillum celere]SFC12934.1 transcriptional regulator, LysR family [Marinospirillum celere]
MTSGFEVMDQLRAIKYFVKVAETKSFSQAAKHFRVPPSSLSRRVADLEASLEATLLTRSTRVVKLTEIGQRYYRDVTEVLAQLDATDEAVRLYQTEPMGRLRMSATVGFGEQILLPLMDRFNQRYPQVQLDITLSDELSVLDRDDVDIAIRGGYAPDARVVAIKLMDNDFIAVAAPAYLAEYGSPGHPLELKNHKGLYFRTPQGPTRWICELEGRWQDVSAPSVATSNAGHWLLKRALLGEGILMLPTWVLKPYLETGELVPVVVSPGLQVTTQPGLAIYLLYQQVRYQVPKIRAAVDFLVAEVPRLSV